MARFDTFYCFRNLTEYERQFLLDSIEKLQDCRFDFLRPEFSLDDYAWVSEQAKKYHSCVGHFNLLLLHQCTRYLWPECQQGKVYQSLMNNCHLHMDAVYRGQGTANVRRSAVDAYRKCTGYFYQLHHNCVPLLTHYCKMSRLRVYKTIRSSAELTLDVAIKHPNSYIIHQMRDPRGILVSRTYYKAMSLPLRQEAEKLCAKLLADLRTFRQLQREGVKIFQMKYEELASDPAYMLEKIYKFVNETLPDSTRQAVLESTHSSVFFESGFFYTSRKNGSKTAFAWRNTLKEADKKVIDVICHEFLTEARYSI